MLTQARLKELLSYDPLTGGFTRLKRVGRSGPVGSIVKTPHIAGYLTAAVDGQEYLQHRLVWLWVHGVFPPEGVDHINGVRSDNRLANLRLANKAENAQNKRMQRNNTSGCIGMSWRANRGHWIAQLNVHGKHHYLGGYKTIEQAAAAYAAAKACLHEFQPTAPGELILHLS